MDLVSYMPWIFILFCFCSFFLSVFKFCKKKKKKMMKKKVLCPICDFVFVFVQNFTLDNKTIKTGSLYCLIA